MKRCQPLKNNFYDVLFSSRSVKKSEKKSEDKVPERAESTVHKKCNFFASHDLQERANVSWKKLPSLTHMETKRVIICFMVSNCFFHRLEESQCQGLRFNISKFSRKS